MMDAGLVVRHRAMMKKNSNGRVESTERSIGAMRLTNSGYDYLDSIRDPKVWRKVKSSAAGAGGFTLELLGDLAKGFIKKQIEDRTGVKL